ncbi:MAG: CAP domain-containing protein [Fusobacteriaceae bacterium]
MKKQITLILFLLLSICPLGATKEQSFILALINKERTNAGVHPLALNKNLNKLATIKSNDMSTNNYFSHNSQNLGSPFNMIKKNKIKYLTAGENIAKGQKTSEEVVNSWMSSHGHRKNILNPKFHEMGISRDSYNKNIWTQLFIGN